MKPRQHIGKLFTAVVLIVFLTWFNWPSPTRVTVTHLSNVDHESWTSATIEFTNHLDEAISIGGGHFIPAGRRDTDYQEGDYAVGIGGPMDLEAHGTYIADVPAPSEAGSYALVFQFTPVSTQTFEYHNNNRAKFYKFLVRWTKPSQATKARWFGSFFVASDPFEVEAHP